jgi:hypothetical protein
MRKNVKNVVESRKKTLIFAEKQKKNEKKCIFLKNTA